VAASEWPIEPSHQEREVSIHQEQLLEPRRLSPLEITLLTTTSLKMYATTSTRTDDARTGKPRSGATAHIKGDATTATRIAECWYKLTILF